MILITAFKPFGFIRGRLMGRNASLDVLERLKALAPNTFYYLVLDVSEGGISKLRQELRKLSPSGVLSMGENALLPGNEVVLEPFAIQCRPSIVPGLFSNNEVVSDFALKSGAMKENSSIGRYYCNAAYLAGLEWARADTCKPVAFIHVPVLGDRDEHVTQVRKILWQMQSY